MRDLLTALAGVVILILVAALAIPPLISWEDSRALIDRTISRSLGITARSEGRIGVRLLPSPRLRLDRLRLGDDPDEPALDIHFIKAEAALTPLLTGAIIVTQARIGRLEVRLPALDDDAILVPADLGAAIGGRDLAFEQVRITQFLVTTTAPSTGRTDQFRADDVRLSAPRLTGPWRVEGSSAGIPFKIATAEPAPDGGLTVKFSGGGDTQPRFEADARVSLVDAPAGAPVKAGLRAVIPEAEGSARIIVGPPAQAAGAYLPVSLGGKFKARGHLTRFSEVAAEIDPGGQAIRLSGSGQIDLRTWRAALSLAARRVDLDAFLLSSAGQGLIARGWPKAGAAPPMMVDLDLAVDSASLGLDDWSGIALGATFDRTGGIVLRRLGATAPGMAALSASGEIDTEPAPRFTGRLSFEAPASDGIGRYLRKLGLDGPAVAVMDGRAILASADVSAASPTLSLRNLRLTLGEALVTGNARYTAAEAGRRGRFDAQVNAEGIDVATLPSLGGALAGLDGHDLGLTLKARDVRYGSTAQSGSGTIAASIQSDGASLVVDSLDVTDVAGANAKLSGRIAPDGSGRIAGRMAAPMAAPLLALLDRVWIAEARLVPAFLRAGALDLDVTMERDAGAADTLRVAAKGDAAGGDLDLALMSRAGRIASLDVTLGTPSAARWLQRDDIAALRRPGRLQIAGARLAATAGRPTPPLGLSVTGAIAGLSVTTARPLVIDPEAEAIETGEVKVETADVAPFLGVLGSAVAIPGPLPAALTIGLTRAGGDAHAAIAGKIAGATVSANLVRAPGGEIGGSAALGRLSLPWLAAALALPTDARGRFAPPPPARARIDMDLRVDALDLGRGLTGRGAAFGLRLDDGALSLSNLTARLAGGALTGTATISRQGGAASIAGDGSVTGAAIADLVGEGPVAGRVTASLRFGASGETWVGLANNLGGSGDVTLSDLTLPGADPSGLGRALTRALGEDDPLRDGRLQALLSEELSAGPFTAKGQASAPATLVGGVLRAGPFALDLDGARWAGTIGLDLRAGRLDARGALTAASAPKGWSGGAPSAQLGFSGPFAKPERIVDAGPLTNGLAAVVLQRELEKIELLEADQTERLRRRARVEMDKARAVALKAAADKAAADKAIEEAARLARLKAQQTAEEAARQARAREADEAARRAAQAEGGPLEVRPPAAQP